jgi:hypothetical protein
MVSSSNQAFYVYKPFLMLIMQGVLMIDALLVAIVSIWELILFHGVLRNNLLYLVQALNQNIINWLTQPRKSLGYAIL